MKKLGFTTLVMFCLFVQSLSGQQLITEVINASPFDFPGTATIGYSFSTGNNPVVVNSLGAWDDALDGFASSVDVGLWDINGNLLAETTLGAGTSSELDGEFRYEDLNLSVVLDANTDYVLGAYRLSGVAYNAGGFDVGIDFLTDPNFTVIEERASSSGGGEPTIEFPDFVFDQGQALVGPNLRFTAVPEPGSATLLALALVMISARRRK